MCQYPNCIIPVLEGQIHSRTPRAEHRVDEHRGVEGHAPAAQAVVAGFAVLCAGCGVPGLGWITPFPVTRTSLMNAYPGLGGDSAQVIVTLRVGPGILTRSKHADGAKEMHARN
jgi:hypothetical protein